MAAVALWGAPGWMVAAWLAALAPLAWLWRGRPLATLVLVAAAIALAGGMRFEAWHDRPPPALAAHVGQEVTIRGRVASEADPGLTTTRYRVEAERVRPRGREWRATDGAVLITLSQFAEYLPGTRVEVSGRLNLAPVFEDFDYRGYLARQGIVGTLLYPGVEVLEPPPSLDPARRSAEVRNWLERGLQRSLPEPEASLAAGISFGRDGNIPRDLYDEYRETALAHIVAVSGSNVSLVAALTFILLVPLVGRTAATFPAAAAIAGYMAVAGFSETVVRAGIMAVIFLAGFSLGRQRSGLAALGAAAIVMTALNPAAATAVGFQLSLAATAGLIVFGPWIRSWLMAAVRRTRMESLVPDVAVHAAALSLAASIATLPLAWIAFGQISLVGPVANIIVEPLFALAFWLSWLAAIAGGISADAGWFVGLAAYYPLAFMNGMASTMASIPGAAIDVPRWDGQAALVAYVGLAALGWPAYRYLAPARPPLASRTAVPRLALAAAAGGALSATALIVSVAPIGGPGLLEVTALDIGQGDAILVTTPGGQRFLFDGGPSGIELARELGAALPHWERRFEAVLLTHPDHDHVAGLPGALRRFRVKKVYTTGAAANTEAFLAFDRRAAATNRLAAGDRFEADGVTFEVLWPPAGLGTARLNDTSLVVRITYGETSFLLTGDLEAAAQRRLLAETSVASTVLKVPHHGSKTSAREFLEAVGAQVAVVSVGAGNRYGHPSPEVLAWLDGSIILRTDVDGRVTVRSDGKRIAIRR
jgi:competence protein ComEC